MQTPKITAFESAYPGSMSERKDGNYIQRDDPASLAAALLETIEQQRRKIEDMQAALDLPEVRAALGQPPVEPDTDPLVRQDGYPGFSAVKFDKIEITRPKDGQIRVEFHFNGAYAFNLESECHLESGQTFIITGLQGSRMPVRAA